MKRALAALAFGLAAGCAQALEAPDPVRFGVRMETGDIAQARAWLEAGLDPNYMASRIGTGLMIGAWEGNVPLMELFLAHGADVNRANALGEQALMLAAWRGKLDAVRWLVERGAQVNREPMKWSALHYAAFAGHGDVVAYLLAQGAQVDARSPNGSTPLMMAVYENREDTARLLLARGADTGVRNERGDGALEWAMRYNRLKIARLVAQAPVFAQAASRPKAEWGEPVRSKTLAEAEPDEIEDLMGVRRILTDRGLQVAELDQRIAALRAQRAKQGRSGGTTRLEITARRNAPREQDARLVEDAPPPAHRARR